LGFAVFREGDFNVGAGSTGFASAAGEVAEAPALSPGVEEDVAAAAALATVIWSLTLVTPFVSLAIL
jgi:hypothetical protein